MRKFDLVFTILHYVKYQKQSCSGALSQVFSCEFCEIFKNTFFPEHIREPASV